MTMRDFLILSFTFFVGLFSGFYLYVTEFRPVYVGDTTDLPEVGALDFNVIGITYGGFVPEGYEHPSYKVDHNGSYDYFPGGVGEIEKREGELPDQLFEELTRAVARANLPEQSESVSNKNCASYADGIEYEYDIVRDGEAYELDTCLTAFSNNTELGSVLLEVWTYLAAPNEYRFSVQNYPESQEETQRWSLRNFVEHQFERSGFDSEGSE